MLVRLYHFHGVTMMSYLLLLIDMQARISRVCPVTYPGINHVVFQFVRSVCCGVAWGTPQTRAWGIESWRGSVLACKLHSKLARTTRNASVKRQKVVQLLTFLCRKGSADN